MTMAIAPTIVLSALMTMAIALTIVVIALMIMASGLINCGHCSYDHGYASFLWLYQVLLRLDSALLHLNLLTLTLVTTSSVSRL